MGVDYGANYGIGYEVVASAELFESEDYDEDCSLEDYIELDETNFESWTIGNSYCGEDEEFYITLKDPFRDGLDLTQRKKALDAELKRLKLEPLSEFNEQGGLYIW